MVEGFGEPEGVALVGVALVGGLDVGEAGGVDTGVLTGGAEVGLLWE